MQNLTFRSALLQDYRRHRVLDADYPAILPEKGGSVRGTVVSGLTEGDRWRLDVFEGDQYERRKVRVRVLRGVGLDEAADLEENAVWMTEDAGDNGEGEMVGAETYVWISAREELEAEEWDFELFKREKMKAWMGDGASWSEEDMQRANGVEVDEGFADVDRAVADEEGRRKENAPGNGHVKDPTGGRGAGGHITKQLKEAQAQKVA